MQNKTSRENNAYVLAVYNRNFIENRCKNSPESEILYFQGIALKSPSVKADNPEISNELDAKIIYVFTPNIEYAINFKYHEIKKEKSNLESILDVKIHIEDTGKEYIPF